MERTKALQVSRALESLDSFEAFADQVEQLVREWDDVFVSTDFVNRLLALMDEEHERREKVLEEL